ncbi:glycoside hydrolase superfamily [Lipomyces oligophaga]|uniref:glycoside hydrolase superfamily n=1 Tax=Lipomyces oligophaga TaxID=45792 RepID=UPI0034CED758
MKCSVFSLAFLLGVSSIVAAQPVDITRRHAHNAAHKRDVIIVTVQEVVTAVVDQWGNIISAPGAAATTSSSSEVDVVVVTAEPTTSSTSSTSSSSTTSSTTSVTPVTTSASSTTSSEVVAVVEPTTSSTTSSTSSSTTSSSSSTTSSSFTTYVTSTSSTSEVSSSSSSTSSSASASASSSGSFSAASLGISYSPYNDDGTCKSASDVASDLSELTSYSVIRLYGIDCSQLANVYAAKAEGQKIFVGIYDVSDLSSAVSTIADTFSDDWDSVHTVSAGNELVNSGSLTASELASKITETRTLLRAAGYTGPVVGVDTFVAIIANPEICQASDYVAANCHPYFDGGVYPDQTGTWITEQVGRLNTACPDQDVIITESGWPTQGDTYGVGVPSKANQEIVLPLLEAAIGSTLIEFTAFNDLWKSPGDYGVEQYWGILN